METALQELGSRTLKLFLRHHTQNPIKSAFVGTISTALFQSSSLVSLIVLAFVGAGILKTYNALGIIFGSNLGTTFTGWIVATIGFKINLKQLAFPLLGLGCLGLLTLQKHVRLHSVSRLVAGIGFLLLGLVYMKASTETLAQQVDIQALSQQPLLIFLVGGILLTAVIQSSSATVMIAISALYAGIIDLESAASVVIGANLGTTITVVIGSLKGKPDKKRVAAAHVTFNLVSSVIAFALLRPLLHLATDILSIQDPLISLVFFHSLFNLIGVFIFLPLTRPFSIQLEKRFKKEEAFISPFISKVDPQVTDAALEALKNEEASLLNRVMAHNLHSFDLSNIAVKVCYRRKKNILDMYEQLKELEGDILLYTAKVASCEIDENESKRLRQINLAVRNAVHSAKCMKDIQHDIKRFRESTQEPLRKIYQRMRSFIESFYEQTIELLSDEHEQIYFESLLELMKNAQHFHDELLNEIYSESPRTKIIDIDLSTILNFNRVLFSANKAFVTALRGFLLEPEQEALFESALVTSPQTSNE